MTAPHDSDTVQPFSSDDARAAVKQQFALGLAALNLKYEKIAAALDINVSTVKAWVDPSRDHCPPVWVTYRLRATHPALATYLETAFEALARNELRPMAHGLTAQANVLTASLAQVLTVHTTAMVGDQDYDRNEAAKLIEVLVPHIEQSKRTLARAQEVVDAGDRVSNVQPISPRKVGA